MKRPRTNKYTGNKDDLRIDDQLLLLLLLLLPVNLASIGVSFQDHSPIWTIIWVNVDLRRTFFTNVAFFHANGDSGYLDMILGTNFISWENLKT